MAAETVEPGWLTALQSAFRAYSAAPSEVAKFKGTKGTDGNYTVSFIEGDGIGPEIAQSVKDIYSAANVRSNQHQQSLIAC